MGLDGDHRSDTDRLDEWLTEEGIKNGSVRPGLTYMCPHGAISLTP